MFEAAPECHADDEKQNYRADFFYQRVIHYAQTYGVFSEHRIFMINKCCTFLEVLQRSQKQNIWPQNAQEPCEEFQNVFQLLIYAIGDRGFLFNDAGFFLGKPNTASSGKSFLPSRWQRSVQNYHEFALAMRRRNYAYKELKALRKHLDEHSKQDRAYGTYDLVANASASLQDKVVLLSMVQSCNQQSSFPAKKLTAESPEIEKLARLLCAIRRDRLLKKVEPFIIFLVLSEKVKCEDIQDAAYIKSLLKPSKKLFDSSFSASDCELFSKIMEYYSSHAANVSAKEHSLFDPYELLNDFRIVDNLQITDDDLVQLAHLCEDCFTKPYRKKELQQFRQPMHDVAIGEIMLALFVLFDAQTYTDRDLKEPRGWNKAKMTLQAAKILPTDAGEIQDASQIHRILKERYEITRYNFIWELFWLITGYVPPPLFDWGHNQGGNSLLKNTSELYAACDYNLNETFDDVCAYFIKEWDKSSLSPELRFDIAKVRRTFADVKTTTQFLKDLENKMILWSATRLPKELAQNMAEYCLEQYKTVLSPTKEKDLKSLQKFGKVMGYAMADEAIKHLCADTYARVFRLLASLNQYLWSITQ